MKKLGFGYLRLPSIEAEEGKNNINYPLLCEMTDAFLAGGGNYFDTAYTYLGGLSEKALKDCLVTRHPRSAFRIADKLPTWKVEKPEDMRRFFDEQLERVGVDYFDAYLLHSLNRENYEIAERFDMFSFLRKLKADGEARRIGFSYHDGPELLDKILTEHPCVDIVQLQINYLDWRSPSLQAEKLYEVAVKHGKAIVVMEPVKGGSLASLPAEHEARLREMEPALSTAAWAFRFVQGLPGVEVVLSGMNTMEQLRDNHTDAPALTQEQCDTLMKIGERMRSTIAIPCTGCAYCVEHCPHAIPTPEYFALYNEYAREPREIWKMQHIYDHLAETKGSPANCARCGMCESVCPQRIEIIDWLEKVAVAFDEEMKKAQNRVRCTPGAR